MQAQWFLRKFPWNPEITKNRTFAFTLCWLLLCFFWPACFSFAQTAGAAASQVTASSLLPPPRPEVITYNRLQYELYFASIAWYLLGLCLAVKLGLGRRVLDRVDQILRINTEDGQSRLGFGRSFVRISLLFAILSFGFVIWRLPITFSWFMVERRYGFATQGIGLWLSDRLAAYAIDLASIPAVWFGYWLIQRSPRKWWLWLWAASIPWLIAMVAIVPVVVDPVYNHFTPLPDSPLRRDILALARKAGIGEVPIYRVDSSKRSTKVNAYVTGIGPTKRIVIWDNTLSKLSHDQILAVLGHEMGHYVLHHIWRSVVVGSFGAFCLLFVLSKALPWSISRVRHNSGIRGITDPAGLPLAMLLLQFLFYVQTPVENAILRYNEHEADRYGLQLTHLNEAAARVFAGFVRQNYSDPDPPRFIVFWLYSHPPIKERVEFALTYGG